MLTLNYENNKYFAGSKELVDLRQIYVNGRFYDVYSEIYGTHKHYFIDDTKHNITWFVLDLCKNRTVYATEYTVK